MDRQDNIFWVYIVTFIALYFLLGIISLSEF